MELQDMAAQTFTKVDALKETIANDLVTYVLKHGMLKKTGMKGSHIRSATARFFPGDHSKDFEADKQASAELIFRITGLDIRVKDRDEENSLPDKETKKTNGTKQSKPETPKTDIEKAEDALKKYILENRNLSYKKLIRSCQVDKSNQVALIGGDTLLKELVTKTIIEIKAKESEKRDKDYLDQFFSNYEIKDVKIFNESDEVTENGKAMLQSLDFFELNIVLADIKNHSLQYPNFEERFKELERSIFTVAKGTFFKFLLEFSDIPSRFKFTDTLTKRFQATSNAKKKRELVTKFKDCFKTFLKTGNIKHISYLNFLLEIGVDVGEFKGLDGASDLEKLLEILTNISYAKYTYLYSYVRPIISGIKSIQKTRELIISVIKPKLESKGWSYTQWFFLVMTLMVISAAILGFAVPYFRRKEGSEDTDLTDLQKIIPPNDFSVVNAIGDYIVGVGNSDDSHISNGNITFADDVEYTGDLQNGLPNGQGKMVYENGVKEGQFKNGFFHGFGQQIDSENNMTWAGDWVNEVLVGKARVIDNNILYVTEYQDGKPIRTINKIELSTSGDVLRKTHFYKDGGIYSGKLNENNNPHGWGVTITKNGDTYEGGFRNGERHGKGFIKTIGGSKMEVKYDNGVLKRFNEKTTLEETRNIVKIQETEPKGKKHGITWGPPDDMDA